MSIQLVVDFKMDLIEKIGCLSKVNGDHKSFRKYTLLRVNALRIIITTIIACVLFQRMFDVQRGDILSK